MLKKMTKYWAESKEEDKEVDGDADDDDNYERKMLMRMTKY